MARKRDYQPGETIAGTVYQVVRTLGAGGMGTVYDVEDTTIGKRYVLKTLHPELGDRQDLARRMQNEARTLARLNHPNIVEVVTAGVTADDLKLPYYVMERLNGQNLRIVLQKKGQLELPHAYHIAIDLLDALDHAHDKGVIHRDVKPDNIFLHKTVAGVTVTKLLDFGIMTLLDGGRGETGGRFLGTLRYAAPEQLKGEKPTPKMDLYAAALVLFEMITGRGPFDDAGEQHRVAAARLHEPPPRLGRFVQAPQELESLMRSALSIDPNARPRDAFSFAAQLRNLKRASASVPPRDFESTENRSTVNAVLSYASEPSRPAIVKVQPDVAMTPLSPLAVTPMAQAIGAAGPVAMGQPGPASSPAPMSSPAPVSKTTMMGMAPPTVSGATLENAPSSAIQAASASFGGPGAAPPSVDRSAPTHSLIIDTPRSPQDGTNPLGSTAPLAPSAAAPPMPSAFGPGSPPAPGAAAQQPQPAGVVPSTLRVPSQPPPAARVPTAPSPQFVWPAERREHDRSESAQVHSMNAPAAGPSRGRTAIVLAVVATVVVGGVSAAGFVMWRGAKVAAAQASASVAPAEPAPAPSAAAPVASATAAASTPAEEAPGAAPAGSSARAAGAAPGAAATAAAPVPSAPAGGAVANASPANGKPAAPAAKAPAAATTTAQPTFAPPPPPPADDGVKVRPGF